jgi:hypothetical protein
MPNYIALGKYTKDTIWQFIDEIDSPTFEDAKLEADALYPELQELRLIIPEKEALYSKIWTQGEYYG